MESCLKDRFGRPVTQLRISLTQRCNLECIYCHREGYTSEGKELSPEEFERLVEAAARLGVRKVKLTGGEPLLREDLPQIVERLAGVKGVREVSLTTNGILLAEQAWKLKEAGLTRVNIGLPSLNEEAYKAITGKPYLPRVLKGIAEAEKAGLTPVKLNMVVLKGLNEEEWQSALKLIEGRNMVLQLIELERVGVGEVFYEKYYVSLDGIEGKLKQQADWMEIRSLHNRRVYHLRKGRVRVELVRPFHNSEFCANCRRLRVTANGRLKPCLMRNDNLVDVAPLLHNPSNLERVEEALRRAVALREPYYPDCLNKGSPN